MKSLTQFIKEALSDYGLESDKISKFEVATSAFYLASFLKMRNGAKEWQNFVDFANKWGHGKELTKWDYSGMKAKKVSAGPGLILFVHKDFKAASIEDYFEEMYNFQWYYVPDMGKWSTYSDDNYTCFGQGMPISCDGKIDKSKVSTYTQFKWDSKEEMWIYKNSEDKTTNKRFIFAETKRLNYTPVVLHYEEVLAASQNEDFVDEYTAALDNNFASIEDDVKRYNELQDRLKKEFENRNILRSLWSTGNINDQLDSLTGGHAKDIMDYLTKEMGSRVSTFNVPERLQNEICKQWKDDIEDEDMLRKWMSMDGHTASDNYFRHKFHFAKRKIDVTEEN